MSEDGPQPMRGLKAAQKTPTAADQFHSDHQEAYEARGKETRDRVETVHKHNSGYPKLWDELERRRSLAKMTAIEKKRNVIINNAASTKVKQKKVLKIKNKPIPSRQTSRNPRHNRRGRIITRRVTKLNSKFKNKDKRPKYAAYSKNKNTMNNNYNELDYVQVDTDKKVDENKSHEGSTKSVSSFGKYSAKTGSSYPANPDSDVVSFSSYNSFGTLDQEPMDRGRR